MKHLFTLIALLVVGVACGQTPPGNALSFDGGDDYITFFITPVFYDLSNNDFTVEFWVKPDVNGTGAQYLFAVREDASNYASIVRTNTGEVSVHIKNNGNDVTAITSSTLPAAQWTHLAVTWSALSQQLQVYFNGNISPLSPGSLQSAGVSVGMTLGAATDGNINYMGEMDEYRIWDVVRDTCAIKIGMHSEFTAFQPNLVGHYHFNQGNAGMPNPGQSNLADLAGNNFGDLNNFSLTGNTSNWVNSGADMYLTDQNGTYYIRDTVTICYGSNYTFPDGTTQSGIYNPVGQLSTLQAANGCDSLIHTLLFLHTPHQQQVQVTLCPGDSYIFPNGDTLHNITNWSLTTHVFQDMNGCDSSILTEIFVTDVDVSLTTVNDTITSNANWASYQWLDCDNGLAPIQGATDQEFVAPGPGNYAVEVTFAGCVDTSACQYIGITGIDAAATLPTIQLFPNPTRGVFTITGINSTAAHTIQVFDMVGQLVQQSSWNGSQAIAINLSLQAKGQYLVKIIGNHFNATKRITLVD